MKLRTAMTKGSAELVRANNLPSLEQKTIIISKSQSLADRYVNIELNVTTEDRLKWAQYTEDIHCYCVGIYWKECLAGK